MKGQRTETCPRCNARPIGFPAVSRWDNKTLVCGPCGTDEAMVQYGGGTLKGPSEWPVTYLEITTAIEDASDKFRRTH